MSELLTGLQMRARETAAIESGAVTGLALMERAGRGVVTAIWDEWPGLASTSHHAVVMCGPGNNGGDGFVIARLLREWGWSVAVYFYGNSDRLPPDAKVNFERWTRMGTVAPLEHAPRSAHAADLFVDALFGTGLRRPLEGAALACAKDWASNAELGAKTVAVDLPSGLCADSGRDLQSGRASFSAALTVTFHAPKLGHYLADGPSRCGRLRVVDIGLGVEPDLGNVTRISGPRADMLRKTAQMHKYSHGHALILSGGAGRTGAARLAARAALRIGAGVVTLGVPPAAQMEVACQITAVMLRRVGDRADLSALLADMRINALCLGPGMGVSDDKRAWLELALKSGRHLVLDADALTLIAGDPALFHLLHAHCVLTPHAGEFARLFPDLATQLDSVPTKGPAYSKVEATRAAAARSGCVVLFKGHDTVIAAPDGQCCLSAASYEHAAPWLATAGAGDVLAGFVIGLLARGIAPVLAAQMAAWLHVECARKFGPGLIAEDLPEVLPAVLRGLPD